MKKDCGNCGLFIGVDIMDGGLRRQEVRAGRLVTVEEGPRAKTLRAGYRGVCARAKMWFRYIFVPQGPAVCERWEPQIEGHREQIEIGGTP